MKQRLSLLVNLLLFTAVIQAAPVSKTEAQKKAKQFISGKVAAARGTSTPDLQLATADGDNYYVFNVSGQQGFVIVSGDDRAPEILGYSDEGQFDAANIPSNMKAWLQGYADEIQELKNMPEVAGARSAARVPERNWAAIDPLIQTKWNQNAPYNGMLPAFGNDECVTGCVATAMAQVLYYVASKNDFTFPSGTTTGIPGYTTEKYGLQVPAVPQTNFDWDGMKLAYSNNETNDAVAKLMLCCGASVNMDYANSANGGSEASSSNVPSAFQTYFGFDGSVRYVKRSYYTIDEWESLIYDEISNERPVLYGGQKASGSGHEFICDGYDGSGLFHINWGWGGSSNGFFVLWTANSNGGGIGAGNGSGGYSMDQDAVIGIQKPTGEPAPEEIKRLTVQSLSVDGGQEVVFSRTSVNQNFTDIPIRFNVANATSQTFNVYFSLGLYDSQDNLVEDILGNVGGGSCPPGGYYNLKYTAAVGARKTGTFRIIPISKENSSSPWLKDEMSDQYYIEATMTETQLTLRVMPIVDLEVTDVEFPGVNMEGIAQKVKATVKNNGSEYNGNLYLRVNNQYVTGEGVALRAGEETDVYFYYVPSSSGTNSYNICLSTDGSQSLKTGTVEIAAFSATDRIDLEKKFIVNNKTDGAYIFGDYMDLTLVAKNNSSQVYRGWIKLSTEERTFDPNSPITIAPGDSVELNYVVGMTIGEPYEINSYQIYQNGGYYYQSYYSSPITYTAAEGVELLLADGTSEMVVAPTTFTPTPFITAVDLRGLTTVTAVDANYADNNCLFLVDENSEIDGLPTTNVIRGTTAAKVELSDDGVGFTAPIDFTATEITYSRTFTQGTDGTGSGWTTIVLPFDVQKVMVGDKEINWFHSSSDTGKQFWLRELKSDAEGSVTFDYVDELKANTPYIIAVPGNNWGEEWNLTNLPITFVGVADAQIDKDAEAEAGGEHYNFVGTTIRQQLNDVYALNDEGSTFKFGQATVAPFRAYFTPLADSNASRLIIRSYDGKPTAITMPEQEPIVSGEVYSLDGRKVKGNLPKGVYIVNGKKMIK